MAWGNTGSGDIGSKGAAGRMGSYSRKQWGAVGRKLTAPSKIFSFRITWKMLSCRGGREAGLGEAGGQGAERYTTAHYSRVRGVARRLGR